MGGLTGGFGAHGAACRGTDFRKLFRSDIPGAVAAGVGAHSPRRCRRAIAPGCYVPVKGGGDPGADEGRSASSHPGGA